MSDALRGVNDYGLYGGVELVDPFYYHRPVASPESVQAQAELEKGAEQLVDANPDRVVEVVSSSIDRILATHQERPYKVVNGFANTGDRIEYEALSKFWSKLGSFARVAAGKQFQAAMNSIWRTDIIPVHGVHFEYYPHEGSRYPARYEPWRTTPFHIATDGSIFGTDRIKRFNKITDVDLRPDWVPENPTSMSYTTLAGMYAVLAASDVRTHMPPTASARG